MDQQPSGILALSLPDTSPVEETLTDMWNTETGTTAAALSSMRWQAAKGLAAGTNGHGLVVELVLGEGDLWPSNVGNELGFKDHGGSS